MNSIHVIDVPDQTIYGMKYAKSGEANMYIRGVLCCTWFDLVREISLALKFPPYFGWNGPAMYECLGDLDQWLSFDHMVWIFDDWQLFFQAEEHPEVAKENLLDLLQDIVTLWEKKGIPLEIYINNRSEANDGFMHSAMIYASKKLITPHAREWIKKNVLTD